MMSVKPSFHSRKAWVTRWWFETLFFSTLLGDDDPNLTNICSMGLKTNNQITWWFRPYKEMTVMESLVSVEVVA